MKLKFLVFFLFVISNFSSAQTFNGIVSDENKKLIDEVIVYNKSTNKYTNTDSYGKFSIRDTSLGDTLQFYHIGYKEKMVLVKNLKTSLNVTLYTKTTSLNEIVISKKIDALSLIANIDIAVNPVNSSQDVLKKVPGLFIGQHAGGGKAEQIFLRGFDIDHGTDINITVDGLPVNMVSHAHGQGYADLHFLIPETINKIDFGKGPYYENKGNFNTAGFVNFKTKRKLENNSLKLELGKFNTSRLLGMFNLFEKNNQNSYVSAEFLSADGPFESPQNFNRINLFGKYTNLISNTDKIGITLSHFTSKWDASGQIPQRAVDSGEISRFGAIDDTEGGNTSRNNLLINYDKSIDKETSLKSSLYLSQYDFELYSNFTFFLEDPINGDQIRQKENRLIYGLNSEYETDFFSNKIDGSWNAGISLRHDQSLDNELSRTANRSETLEQIQLGDIYETNLGAYIGSKLNIDKWTFNPSIRIDYFDFQYNDSLILQHKTQTENQAIVSPKLNILYSYSNTLQLYLKTGKGFHSNDTRVVITEQTNKTLPAAYGFDSGFIWKPTSKMLLNMAYWYLFLEQEFVYVGDAGIVEPSGKTRRLGLDLSYRYQPIPWLVWNLDANYTHARSIEEIKGQDFIPLAPSFTFVNGISIVRESGLYGNLNIRHLADRPANEDNSIIAEGYTITDLNIGYKWKNVNLGIQIQNLFDNEWNETQFATESRLQNEAQPIEEIHFTPGTPFFIKTMIEYKF